MMFYTVIFLILVAQISTYMKCTTKSTYTQPKYHLVKKCHRSNLGTAGRANFTSLINCKRFGIEKKALSLNFSPHSVRGSDLEYNCELLKCAEADGGLSLSNESRYDHYSLYANPLPNINSTCVPATGMFIILPKKFNYTASQAQCKNVSAILADVTDEQRTDALAQALVTASVDAAYVGMRRNHDKSFLIDNENSLDCITYRAWAPGHPQRNVNMSCVILTKDRTWKTVACTNKYQPLCELLPGGPYKKTSLFSLKRRNGTENQKKDFMNN